MREGVNAIGEFRQARKQKQEDLGVLVGVEQTKVSGYETGRVQPTLQKAFELAIALRKPVHEVFHGLYAEASDAVASRELAARGHQEEAIPPPL
jgi:transcriptional regulator with XRE-family HTH domain